LEVCVLKYLNVVVAFLLLTAKATADRPILLVTPEGIYQAEVTKGIPGPWKVHEIDVIVRGFKNIPDSPPNVPDPPASPEDPTVRTVQDISKRVLKDKQEAMALVAILDSFVKAGVSGTDFKEALELAIPIADTSLKAQGRMTKWLKEVMLMTVDSAKIKAGLTTAFAIDAGSLQRIAAASEPGAVVTEEALDIVAIIQLVQLVLELLRNLGIAK
jgi:hypothetical protein